MEFANIYYKFYKNSCDHFLLLLEKKLKGSNTLKNNGDPVYKTVTVPDVYSLLFVSTIGKKFTVEERRVVHSTKESTILYIRTIERLVDIFTVESVFRMHPRGDFSLVTPWYTFSKEYVLSVNEKTRVFCTGTLVLPVKTLRPTKIFCFLPSSGLEDDDAYLPDEIQLDVNDYIEVKNQWYQVLGVALLREKPGFIYTRFTRQFSRDATNPTLGYAKRTTVKRKLV